jgi:hypothetical protein
MIGKLNVPVPKPPSEIVNRVPKGRPIAVAEQEHVI